MSRPSSMGFKADTGAVDCPDANGRSLAMAAAVASPRKSLRFIVGPTPPYYKAIRAGMQLRCQSRPSKLPRARRPLENEPRWGGSMFEKYTEKARRVIFF